MDENEVYVYAVGLCYMSICAPNGMSIIDVEREANKQHPSGVHPWSLVTDRDEFSDGTPMPGPCDTDPENRTHYLLSC